MFTVMKVGFREQFSGPARSFPPNRVCTSLVFLLGPMIGGCVQPAQNAEPAGQPLNVQSILAQTEAAYSKLITLEVRGWLRDHRGTDERVLPIQWQFARPDQCRLQIGMDMALVKGQNWWSYDDTVGRFKTHREVSATPIEAAAYFLSNRIPFFMPQIWERPKFAFGTADVRSSWRLEGVAWTARRPCYVISRQGRGRDAGSRWTLWIDQDRFLLVAWTWEGRRESGHAQSTSQVLCACVYDVLAPDESLDRDQFRIEKPSPIVLPRSAPTEPAPPRG